MIPQRGRFATRCHDTFRVGVSEGFTRTMWLSVFSLVVSLTNARRPHDGVIDEKQGPRKRWTSTGNENHLPFGFPTASASGALHTADPSNDERGELQGADELSDRHDVCTVLSRSTIPSKGIESLSQEIRDTKQQECRQLTVLPPLGARGKGSVK
ncbi:hypothetical protein L208DRAFT_1408661 [Tricholoma matsutake]|nr:hypothetical protein L208DRAFT_1408661 [Tricholoma matsutake 945]